MSPIKLSQSSKARLFVITTAQHTALEEFETTRGL
jgi:hypothetical protein